MVRGEHVAVYFCYIYIRELPAPHMEAVDAQSLHEAITASCKLLRMFGSADRAELFDGGRKVAAISHRDAERRLGGYEDPLERFGGKRGAGTAP